MQHKKTNETPNSKSDANQMTYVW